MRIPELSENLSIISQLGDIPGTDDGLSADELKAKFDEAVLIIQRYINQTLLPNVNAFASPEDGLTMRADIAMGNHRVKDVAAPEEDGDAVSLGYMKEHTAPAGYGLGGDGSITLRTLAEVDAFKVNGWRKVVLDTGQIGGSVYGTLSCDAGDRYVKQTFTYYYASYGGFVTLERGWYLGRAEWEPWEWKNPPMIPGVEYRTTERCNGKAVYAKRITYTLASAVGGSGMSAISIPTNINGHSGNVRVFAWCASQPLPLLSTGEIIVNVNRVESTEIALSVFNISLTAGTEFVFDLYYVKSKKGGYT